MLLLRCSFLVFTIVFTQQLVILVKVTKLYLLLLLTLKALVGLDYVVKQPYTSISNYVTAGAKGALVVIRY